MTKINQPLLLNQHKITSKQGNKTTILNILNLIESVILLSAPASIEEVLEQISVTDEDKSTININIRIKPKYKAVIYGKQFSNISCLRKLVSNSSGRDGYFYKITTAD